ncbi:MAG: hypothetical protein LUE29_00400 [Lachnospiraceae bacterium]|nr:hypothetical protein [Lachnospiraceae bacterium]
MITLFDQREVMEDFIASEIANEDKRKSESRARTLYKNGVPVDVIALTFDVSTKTVENWLDLVPQV